MLRLKDVLVGMNLNDKGTKNENIRNFQFSVKQSKGGMWIDAFLLPISKEKETDGENLGCDSVQ